MGLTQGFGPKWSFFQLFFLGNIGQEDVFYDLYKEKMPFLSYKNRKLKTVEKLTFFLTGLTDDFWSKNGHFSIFSF